MNRPGRAVYAERIEFCRMCLNRRMLPSQIRKAFREHFKLPKMCFATIDRYALRAREMILADIGEGRRVERAKAKATFEGVFQHPAAQPRDIIHAQEALCRLLGLHDRTPPNVVQEFLDALPPELSGPIRDVLSGKLPGASQPERPPAKRRKRKRSGRAASD